MRSELIKIGYQLNMVITRTDTVAGPRRVQLSRNTKHFHHYYVYTAPQPHLSCGLLLKLLLPMQVI